MKELVIAAVLLVSAGLGGLWGWCSVEPSKWGDLSYVASSVVGGFIGLVFGIWVLAILAAGAFAWASHRAGSPAATVGFVALTVGLTVLLAMPLWLAAPGCVECVASWGEHPTPPDVHAATSRPAPPLPPEPRIPAPVPSADLVDAPIDPLLQLPNDLDPCPAEDWQHLVGQPVELVPRSLNGPNLRVACQTCPITTDARPKRMNVWFDEETRRIQAVDCG